MRSEHLTLSEIIGPWKDPNFESGLIKRCRNAWCKPVESLSNQELATCLRQNIAIAHLIPIAKKRVEDRIDDDTEIYDGELAAAIDSAERSA